MKLKQVTIGIFGREYTVRVSRCIMCADPAAVVMVNDDVIAAGHANADATMLDGYLQTVLPTHVYDALNFALEQTPVLN